MIRGIRLTLLFLFVFATTAHCFQGVRVHSWRIEVGRLADKSKADALRQEIVDLTDLTASVDRLDNDYVVTAGEFSFPEEASHALPSLQKAGFKNARVVMATLSVTKEPEMAYSLEVTPVDNLLSAWQPQVEMLQRNMAPVSILSTTGGYLIRAGHFTDKNRAQEVLHQLHHEGYPYAKMIEILQSTTQTKTQLVALEPVLLTPTPQPQQADKVQVFALQTTIDQLNREIEVMRSVTATPTASPSSTATETTTPTASVTPTLTQTVTPSPAATLTATQTATRTEVKTAIVQAPPIEPVSTDPTPSPSPPRSVLPPAPSPKVFTAVGLLAWLLAILLLALVLRRPVRKTTHPTTSVIASAMKRDKQAPADKPVEKKVPDRSPAPQQQVQETTEVNIKPLTVKSVTTEAAPSTEAEAAPRLLFAQQFEEKDIGREVPDWQGRYTSACLMPARNRAIAGDTIYLKMVKEQGREGIFYCRVLTEATQQPVFEFDLLCLEGGSIPIGLSLESTTNRDFSLSFAFQTSENTTQPQFLIDSKLVLPQAEGWQQIRCTFDLQQQWYTIDLNGNRVLTQTPLPIQVESINIIGLKAPASASGTLLVKELKVLG